MNRDPISPIQISHEEQRESLKVNVNSLEEAEKHRVRKSIACIRIMNEIRKSVAKEVTISSTKSLNIFAIVYK